MSEGWGVLFAMAAVLVPLLLAWWLVARSARRQAQRAQRRGKMHR